MSKRFMLVVFASLVFLLSRHDTSAAYYADKIDVDYVPPAVTPIVRPIVKARWNYRGIILASGDEVQKGLAYYNKYLPFIETLQHTVWDVKHPKGQRNSRRAAVGCTNLAIGEIMYTHQYPDVGKLPDKKIQGVFKVDVIDLTNHAKSERGKEVSLFGGTSERNFYNWSKIPRSPQMDDVFYDNVTLRKILL